MSAHAMPEPRYNGLTEPTAGLPNAAYLDEAHYQRDLETIWYRNWLCVGRSGRLAEPLAFLTFRVGAREVLLVRDEKGVARGFHNACRHRGSALRREACGRLKSKLITCPYHAWSYSLRGDLVRVSSTGSAAGFDKADYPLIGVHVAEWRGLLFVNLADAPAETLADSFDPTSGDLSNWPMEELVTGHVLTKTMDCNWKVFWENFNECLHCPGVHPELSALVPIFGRGLMARHDDPDWKAHAQDDAPQYSGALRAGAETWSSDGAALQHRFSRLTEAERTAGQTYAMNLPSMFVVGHVDHVRTVRLLPLGPQKTELVAEWMFAPEAMDETGRIASIVEFSTLVLEQDAAICEVNQRGLASARHEAGVLMPEEYEIARFHDWVRMHHRS